MAPSKTTRTRKTKPATTTAVDVEGPSPKNPLRERTEAALRLKADKRAAYIAAQVKAFYDFMGPLADQGLCEGEYRKDLCEEARKQLKDEGIKLSDHGEHVCSLFAVKW